MTVEELIEALSLMPSKDEVLIFDGLSREGNFCQQLRTGSVRMSDNLNFVIISAA